MDYVNLSQNMAFGNKHTSIQNEFELLTMKSAVKDMGDGGMSDSNREGGNGPGNDRGGRCNMLNSGHRGTENRGGNCGRVEEGCSDRGGNLGKCSTDKGGG